ncbi:MAG: DNA internalization-related competence protein ComEC/Rec2, partial [Psychrobium sp.]|nr:DNA internalization-related competence protein ComEC/Rec2 [Psychrobium sp.]
MERLLIGFIIGLLSLMFWPSIPAWWLGACLLVIGVIVVKTRPFLASCLFGLSYCILAINHHFNDLEQLSKANSSIIGHIISLPVQGKYHNRFYFKLTHLFVQGKKVRSNAKLLLVWPGEHRLAQGQQLKLSIVTRPLHDLANQGGFNGQKWQLSKGLIATGKVLSGEVLSTDIGLRGKLAATLQHQLAHLDNQRFIRALSIGDKQMFDQQDWRLLSKTGTSHLFAISGLHLSIVAMLCALLIASPVRLLFGHHVLLARRITLVTALVICTCYSYLAGFSLPTLRALLMLCIAALFLMAGQRLRLSQMLLLSFAALLVIDPLSMLSLGFWLSFCAVAIIFIFVSRGRRQSVELSGWKKVRYWCQQLLIMQLMLSGGMVALQLMFFEGSALLAPLANVIAVPLVSLIILPLCLLALFGLILAPSNSLSALLYEIVDWLLNQLFVVLSAISNLDISWLALGEPIMVLVACLALALVLLSSYLRRITSLMIGGFCLVIVTVSCLFISGDKADWQIHFLDVGHGNAAVIVKNGQAIIVDSARSYLNANDELGSVASNIILPFLNRHGIKNVNFLVITHQDNDHNGGMRTLLAHLPNARLITNVSALDGLTPTPCDQLSFKWQQLQLTFSALNHKYSARAWAKSQNNNSCLLHVDDGIYSALFVGDIEKPAEKYYLQRAGQRLRADILQVAHHG